MGWILYFAGVPFVNASRLFLVAADMVDPGYYTAKEDSLRELASAALLGCAFVPATIGVTLQQLSGKLSGPVNLPELFPRR